MEEKYTFSEPFTIKVPCFNNFKPIDNGVSEIPEDQLCDVIVRFLYTDDEVIYTQNDYWHYNDSDNTVYVKVNSAFRMRYIESMKKKLNGAELTREEELIIEDFELVINAAARHAAEEAERMKLYKAALSELSTNNKEKAIANKDNELSNTIDTVFNEEKLPVLNFKKQYMNNTKLSRVLTTDKTIKINDKQLAKIDIKVNERIVNLVNIWTDDNITLSSDNITQYDMAVMDAAYTIMSQGPMVITPEWILKVMSGNPKQRITEKKISEVKESINKLQSIRIKVDCTSEYNEYMKKQKKKPVDNYTYESYLLPLGKVEARYEANGKIVTAYTVLQKPALYQYAEMNHQIVDVPAYLLETQSQFNDTTEAILIKRYVIKRVAQIVKNNKLNSNKISFLWYDKSDGEQRGLLPELGYENYKSEHFRKKVKPKINKIVKGTLQSLKDASAITDFEEYREDGTKNPTSPIAGYKIYFKKELTVLSNK